MKRNIILTALVCMFCQFGALGAKDGKTTLTCLFVGIVAVFLCVWRCSVLARRRNERRQYENSFTEYMRATRDFRR